MSTNTANNGHHFTTQSASGQHAVVMNSIGLRLTRSCCKPPIEWSITHKSFNPPQKAAAAFLFWVFAATTRPLMGNAYILLALISCHGTC